jgi:hypothetical protein
MTRRVDLEYDDVEVGNPELGFMPRDPRIFTGKDGWDEDAEDRAYEKWLAAKGVKARICEGMVFIDD